MNRIICIAFSIICTFLNAQEKLSVSTLFSDGMVLQQKTEIEIWGWGTPNKVIKIMPNWATPQQIKTNENGVWKTKLKTKKAGGPYSLTISDNDSTIIISKILMGEVWVCSGQSNMGMLLKGSGNDTITNYKQEIKNADYPKIKMFNVKNEYSFSPSKNVTGNWVECNPKTAKNFSGAAYFFAQKLYEELNIPIGIIHTSYGSSTAEAWMSNSSLKNLVDFKDIDHKLEDVNATIPQFQNWLNGLPKLKGHHRNFDTFKNADYYDTIVTDINYDDRHWNEMTITKNWKETELRNFDGVVWYRNTFNFDTKINSEKLTLRYLKIKHNEQVFLNGIEIGNTFSEQLIDDTRILTIPKGVLKDGKNSIAIKVINIWNHVEFPSNPDIFDQNIATQSVKEKWKYWPAAEIIQDKAVLFNENANFYTKPKLHFVLNQKAPTALYNTMLKPIIPYTIKGVAWYQGESNTDFPLQYRTLFPELIRGWRTEWGQGNFPFYYVQIAPFKNYDNDKGKQSQKLREAQFLTMSTPNTGMVSTTDIGSKWRIHPENKKNVGTRLALWALAKNYGFNTIAYSGPLYTSSKFSKNKVFLNFTNTHSGLMLKNNSVGFEIAGKDNIFYPANAQIKGDQVILNSEKVSKPIKARYGWSNWVDASLFNKDGLSAPTFRTYKE